jgi:hypothetical protein
MNVTQPHAGIATSASVGRMFDFCADTFSYPNELIWEYQFDPETGKAATRKNDPPPAYAHHCFVVVRSAKQFFLHARFAPERKTVDANSYRSIIRSVVGRSPYRSSTTSERIPVPGFSNLRQFSATHPDLLRETCGGAWQSYVQRGNWRMILPFTRRHQNGMAAHLQKALRCARLPIMHIVTFPSLTINHVLMIFDVRETRTGLEFQCYDPNICEKPLLLQFDDDRQTFVFPRTHYFPGGKVNAYEIYCGLFL